MAGDTLDIDLASQSFMRDPFPTLTRLRAAGGAAGLAAGAWAATIYCLHCPETSAIFVLTWYSVGIMLAAGAGAVLGPRLMRW